MSFRIEKRAPIVNAAHFRQIQINFSLILEPVPKLIDCALTHTVLGKPQYFTKNAGKPEFAGIRRPPVLVET
jgi:hypothetical protein